MSFLEQIGLSMAGFTPEQQAQLTSAEEDIRHIWATYLAVKPRIDRVQAAITMALAVTKRDGL